MVEEYNSITERIIKEGAANALSNDADFHSSSQGHLFFTTMQ